MPCMTGRIGFDNERYLSEQTAAILERVARFGNKLYLEFGGKLLFDQHASRVLPGYDPNVKMRLLAGLADKIDVIPNGVDTARFDRLDGSGLSFFRNMYALPFEQIVFSVGRVVFEKGLHLLISAMPAILAQHATAKLVIAGKGPELDALRSQAWRLGVGEKVLLTGFITDEDRDKLFKIASCAVFPSIYEPFGIVALEAMAAKCPVVVTAVGGLKDVVVHNETGIVVYPNNPDSLAWGIVHTLKNPGWSRQRVANAYEIVRSRYNWAQIARDTAGVYRRVAAERAVTDW